MPPYIRSFFNQSLLLFSKAKTRSAEAKGWLASRFASSSVTSVETGWRRRRAICSSTLQNSRSKATLVRCPEREKLRFSSI